MLITPAQVVKEIDNLVNTKLTKTGDTMSGNLILDGKLILTDENSGTSLPDAYTEGEVYFLIVG